MTNRMNTQMNLRMILDMTMRQWLRNATLMGSLLISLLLFGGCSIMPSSYQAEPIEGWVVDAETGKPLEGVNIAASWELTASNGFSTIQVSPIMLMEAVTDVKGRYVFPAWGPLPADHGSLRWESTRLAFFKAGYRAEGRINNDLQPRRTQRSDWNGKTIKLELFKGSFKEYAQHLNDWEGNLRGFRHEECGWKKMPQMILSVTDLRRSFRAQKISSGLPSVDHYIFLESQTPGWCGGGVKNFFEEQKK